MLGGLMNRNCGVENAKDFYLNQHDGSRTLIQGLVGAHESRAGN